MKVYAIVDQNELERQAPLGLIFATREAAEEVCRSVSWGDGEYMAVEEVDVKQSADDYRRGVEECQAIIDEMFGRN